MLLFNLKRRVPNLNLPIKILLTLIVSLSILRGDTLTLPEGLVKEDITVNPSLPSIELIEITKEVIEVPGEIVSIEIEPSSIITSPLELTLEPLQPKGLEKLALLLSLEGEVSGASAIGLAYKNPHTSLEDFQILIEKQKEREAYFRKED